MSPLAERQLTRATSWPSATRQRREASGIWAHAGYVRTSREAPRAGASRLNLVKKNKGSALILSRDVPLFYAVGRPRRHHQGGCGAKFPVPRRSADLRTPARSLPWTRMPAWRSRARWFLATICNRCCSRHGKLGCKMWRRRRLSCSSKSGLHCSRQCARSPPHWQERRRSSHAAYPE